MAGSTVIRLFQERAQRNMLNADEIRHFKNVFTSMAGITFPATGSGTTAQLQAANAAISTELLAIPLTDEVNFVDTYLTGAYPMSFVIAREMLASDAMDISKVATNPLIASTNIRIIAATKNILGKNLSPATTTNAKSIRRDKVQVEALINSLPGSSSYDIEDKANFGVMLADKVVAADNQDITTLNALLDPMVTTGASAPTAVRTGKATIEAQIAVLSDAAAKTRLTDMLNAKITEANKLDQKGLQRKAAVDTSRVAVDVLNFIADLSIKPNVIFPEQLTSVINNACGLGLVGTAVTSGALAPLILAQTGLTPPTLTDEMFLNALAPADIDLIPIDILTRIMKSTAGKFCMQDYKTAIGAGRTPMTARELIGEKLQSKQNAILSNINTGVMPAMAIIQVKGDLMTMINDSDLPDMAKNAYKAQIQSKVNNFANISDKDLKKLESILNRIGKIRIRRTDKANNSLRNDVREFLFVLRGCPSTGMSAITDAEVDEMINDIMMGELTVNSEAGIGGMNQPQFANLKNRGVTGKTFGAVGRNNRAGLLANELGATLACHTIVSNIYKAKGRTFKSKIFKRQEVEKLDSAQKFAANHFITPLLMGAGITALTALCPPAGLAVGAAVGGINVVSKYIGMQRYAASQGRNLNTEEKVAFGIYSGVTLATTLLTAVGAGGLSELLGETASAAIATTGNIASKAGFFVRSYTTEWINATQMGKTGTDKAKFIAGRGTVGAAVGVGTAIGAGFLGEKIAEGVEGLKGVITNIGKDVLVQPAAATASVAITEAENVQTNAPAVTNTDNELDMYGNRDSDYDKNNWLFDKEEGRQVFNPREGKHIMFDGGRDAEGRQIIIDRDVQDGKLVYHRTFTRDDIKADSPVAAQPQQAAAVRASGSGTFSAGADTGAQNLGSSSLPSVLRDTHLEWGAVTSDDAALTQADLVARLLSERR